MRNHGTPPHPGPMRVSRVDGESAAIMVAIAFVVLGLVILPPARLLIVGSIPLGVGIAWMFRLFRKKPLFPERFF